MAGWYLRTIRAGRRHDNLLEKKNKKQGFKFTKTRIDGVYLACSPTVQTRPQDLTH